MKKSHLVTHSVELLQQKRALLGVRLTKSHKVCLQHWYASVLQHSARFSHEETRGVPQHSLVAPKCHQKVQRHLPGYLGYGAGEGREQGRAEQLCPPSASGRDRQPEGTAGYTLTCRPTAGWQKLSSAFDPVSPMPGELLLNNSRPAFDFSQGVFCGEYSLCTQHQQMFNSRGSVLRTCTSHLKFQNQQHISTTS